MGTETKATPETGRKIQDKLHTATMGDDTELACKWAINHVLTKIADDPQYQHLMGAGTEAYALLTGAAAKLWKVPLREVQEKFLPGSAELYGNG